MPDTLLAVEERRLRKNANSRRYFSANREELNARRSLAHARDPEARNAPQRALKRRDRLEALAAYGAQCACCGETTEEFLGIDHINGGGTAHRRERGLLGNNLNRWLRQQGYPSEFQVLCHNCNLAKGFYGACPHG